MSGLFIEGFELPKNKDGTYAVPHDEIEGVQVGAVVMTVMIDQKSNTLEVWPWEHGPNSFYGMEQKYKAVEVVDEQKGA